MLERENLLSSRPTICLESKAGMLLDLSLEQSLLLIYDDDNDETMYICEIPVCIIDTPGLGAMDLSSKEEDLVLASVSVLTDKDLLYYCTSCPTPRLRILSGSHKLVSAVLSGSSLGRESGTETSFVHVHYTESYTVCTAAVKHQPMIEKPKVGHNLFAKRLTFQAGLLTESCLHVCCLRTLYAYTDCRLKYLQQSLAPLEEEGCQPDLQVGLQAGGISTVQTCRWVCRLEVSAL